MKRSGSWQNADEAHVHYARKIHETARAALYEMEDGEEVWIPLSQVVADDGDGVLVVPRWLAESRELEIHE